MAFAFDEREYLRDDLLIEADRWVDDLFGRAEDRQAGEIQRTLGHMLRLKSMVDLNRKETRKVDAAIRTLRAHLVALRIKS